ncbi:MAG: hypothetical protein F6K04_23370 [Leptolyngbya sp. SIO4C5]|uniref:hypothetical protein n=1 Tax=Sphaerothrix gracilis TaxID=3151835 RepID=UPI0013C0D476|nr:hypothetical protein [Leptolyngbya sp. SIO4C5]
MTGFIRGLFGGSDKKKKAAPPKPPKQEKTFFLDADDAKTYGDIDYMRSAKTVKRTFAKKKGVKEELESVRQISALGSAEVDKNGRIVSQASQFGSQAKTDAASSESSQRRRPDSSMDTFRNMARDMKK